MIFVVKQPEELPRKTNKPPAFWPRPRASCRSFCSCWEFKSRTAGYLGNHQFYAAKNFIVYWLVVWNMAFMTFHIHPEQSPQLTNSYFSEGLKPPTSEIDGVKWWSESELFNHKDQISLIYHDFLPKNGSINRVQAKNGVRCDTAVARWRPGCWRSWAHALAPPSTPVRPFRPVPLPWEVGTAFDVANRLST